MGRYLLRRKIVILLAVFFVFPAARKAGAEIREGRSADAEVSAESAGERRSAQRHARREEDFSPGPRQSHGGPEVFSPAFGLNGEAESWLEKLRSSKREAEWILAALRRAQPYAHFIRQTIAGYGLPPEIFYLPVVESLYKIGAHSRSGALGLWQFMRGSAQPWMKINDWLDERKDFWKSTEAAMEKLLYNYRITGDWLLALAAYNCGLGKVQRVMRQSGLTDFWEISRRGLLPRETRAYIPRLIATVHFVSGLVRQGLLPEWQAPVDWRRVPLKQPVDLRLLAEAAGIPAGELRLGNEELRYGITPPADGSYFLKVKAADEPKVREALSRQGEKLMRFALHTIARGHTLSEIALHYGIPVSLLLRYNPGVRAEALRIGSRLVVPLYKETGPYEKKAPPAAAGAASGFQNEYIVRQGDSLWAIARAFGTTSAALAAANGIPENGVLRPGTSLKAPSMKAGEKR
jgi:membrane-bound lytic murein transglycosylase D